MLLMGAIGSKIGTGSDDGLDGLTSKEVHAALGVKQGHKEVGSALVQARSLNTINTFDRLNSDRHFFE